LTTGIDAHGSGSSATGPISTAGIYLAFVDVN